MYLVRLGDDNSSDGEGKWAPPICVALEIRPIKDHYLYTIS